MTFKLLKETFKKEFFVGIGMDILSFGLLLAASTFLGVLFDKKINAINLPDNFMQISEVQAAVISESLQHSYRYFITLIVLWALVTLLIWVISRLYIYNYLIKKSFKPSFKKFYQPMLWILGGAGIFTLLLSVKEEVRTIVLSIFLIVFMYYSMNFFCAQTNKGKIWDNHPKLIITFLLMVGGGYLISTIPIISVITIFILLIYANWARMFFISLKKEVA